MTVQPFLIGEGWIEVRDGDPSLRPIFERHYSAKPNRRVSKPSLIVGPGERLVLLRADARAMLAWRKEMFRRDGQAGVECSVFRNEGREVASTLICEAQSMAWERWPGERLFTFVDPLKVKPTIRAGRPTWGHCFYEAGWEFAGVSKKRLHILERRP